MVIETTIYYSFISIDSYCTIRITEPVLSNPNSVIMDTVYVEYCSHDDSSF